MQKFHTDGKVSVRLCCKGTLLQSIKHYPDLGSDVFISHQYGISAVIPQMSLRRETSGGIMKCQLFDLRLILVDF